MTGGTESVTLATEGDRDQEQQDRESPQDRRGRDAEGTKYQQPKNQTKACNTKCTVWRDIHQLSTSHAAARTARSLLLHSG